MSQSTRTTQRLPNHARAAAADDNEGPHQPTPRPLYTDHPPRRRDLPLIYACNTFPCLRGPDSNSVSALSFSNPLPGSLPPLTSHVRCLKGAMAFLTFCPAGGSDGASPVTYQELIQETWVRI